MRYISFSVENFKGIKGPLSIDVQKYPFLPIVGLNESGKSTILEAIFAFDSFNDRENEGRHLENIRNVWDSGQAPAPKVTAIVHVEPGELLKAIQDADKDEFYGSSPGLVDAAAFTGSLSITRNLADRTYQSDFVVVEDEGANQAIISQLVKRLPYTTLIDDKAGLFPATVQVAGSVDQFHTEWLAMLNRVFDLAGTGYNVFDLEGMDPLLSADVLERVNSFFNAELQREWDALKLSSSKNLSVELKYFSQRSTITGQNSRYVGNYIDITVKETDSSSRPHRLLLSARSRGFWWFFTFAMRLRFTQRSETQYRTHEIVLLDEPASYLHSSAQQEWCAAFSDVGEAQHVIYTTHSQFMLDPQYVPPKSIHFAERNFDGQISLTPFYEAASGKPNQWQSLQPVLDALRIRPYMLHLMPGHQVLITEGIYDFYSFDMFKGSREVTIFPATGATNVEHHLPYMIAWSVEFKVAWDHDEEGLTAREKATAHFGEEIACRHFFTLPVSSPKAKRKLEQLWDKEDLKRIREELGIAANTSFEKTILALYYARNRDDILTGLPGSSSEHFAEVFTHLGW